MSRRLYFVCLVHNTSALPYKLAAEITHNALAGGKFDKVEMLSFYQPIHTMLLPLVGQTGGQFTPSVIELQMPWASARKPAARTKYATAFIEGVEAMQLATHDHFFMHSFRVDLLQRMQSMPENSKILIVITDVRHTNDLAYIVNKCAAKEVVAIRLNCKNGRDAIKCDELDNSFWETLPMRIDKDEEKDFDFFLDDSIDEAKIESIHARVVAIKTD